MKTLTMQVPARLIRDMVGGDRSILTRIIEDRKPTDEIQILKSRLYQYAYDSELMMELKLHAESPILIQSEVLDFLRKKIREVKIKRLK